MPYRQRFSPIPSKNLCPQTHHWRGGCQQTPGGEWLPKSLGTGVRRETEPPTMPGRGGDNKGQEGIAGLVLRRSKVRESGFGSYLLHLILFFQVCWVDGLCMQVS